MLLILFCIAVIGLTHIVVDSHIAELLKKKAFENRDGTPKNLTPLQAEIKYMVNCYQCSGFWVGLLLGILVNPLSGTEFFLLLWLLYACAGSYLGVVGAALLNYLDVVRGG